MPTICTTDVMTLGTIPEGMNCSGIIRFALQELKITREDPDYEIDMHCWHTPPHEENKKCSVCYAGVVMKALGMPIDTNHSLFKWAHREQRFLLALDDFREGVVSSGYVQVQRADGENQDVIIPQSVQDLDFDATQYRDDPGIFMDEMEQLANDLEELGH